MVKGLSLDFKFKASIFFNDTVAFVSDSYRLIFQAINEVVFLYIFVFQE